MGDFDEMRRLVDDVVLPDYSGFGITRFYSMFKTNLAVYNNFARLKTVGGAAKEGDVQFDSDGLFTNNSIITGYGDVTSNLGQEWRTLEIQCQITGHAVNGFSAAQTAITGGSIYKVGSNPAWICPSYSTATPISELNSGNTFSVTVVARNTVSAANGDVLSTHSALDDVFAIRVDRRTNKSHTVARVSSTNYFADLLAQDNTSDFRILTTTVNGGSKLIKAYKNGVFQNSVTYLGNYINDRLLFGNGPFTALTGDILCVIVSTSEWDATAVSALTTKLQAQFGI